MRKQMKKIDVAEVCRKNGIPVPEAEYRFHPKRRWRFDYAFPCQIAIEVNGGGFVGGHHSRGKGQEDDFEKLNMAQILGWRVFQFTPRQMAEGLFVEVVRLAMKPNDEIDETLAEDDVVTIPYHLLHGRFNHGVDVIPFIPADQQ